MGKVITSLFLAVLFACVASCSAKRTITQTSEEIATHAKITNDIDLLGSLRGLRYDSTIQIQTIEFVVYDTERDKVKAEGKITTNTETITETKVEDDVVVSETTKQEVEQEIETTTETKKTEIPFKEILLLGFIFSLSLFCIKLFTKDYD